MKNVLSDIFCKKKKSYYLVQYNDLIDLHNLTPPWYTVTFTLIISPDLPTIMRFAELFQVNIGNTRIYAQNLILKNIFWSTGKMSAMWTSDSQAVKGIHQKIYRTGFFFSVCVFHLWHLADVLIHCSCHGDLHLSYLYIWVVEGLGGRIWTRNLPIRSLMS